MRNARTRASADVTVVAFTCTSSSPARGVGSATCCSWRTSGGPYLAHTTAFMCHSTRNESSGSVYRDSRARSWLASGCHAHLLSLHPSRDSAACAWREDHGLKHALADSRALHVSSSCSQTAAAGRAPHHSGTS
jgi:hypothetical protein